MQTERVKDQSQVWLLLQDQIDIQVARIANIPETKVSSDVSEKVKNLTNIKQKLFGQDHVVTSSFRKTVC